MSPGLQTCQLDTGLFVFLCPEAKLRSFPSSSCYSSLLIRPFWCIFVKIKHLDLKTVIIYCHVCVSPVGRRNLVANIGNKLQAGRSRNCSSIPGRDEVFLCLKTSRPMLGPTQSPILWVPTSDVSVSARKTWNYLSSRTWSRSVQRDNINFTFCGQIVCVYHNFSNLIWSHEFHLNWIWHFIFCFAVNTFPV